MTPSRRALISHRNFTPPLGADIDFAKNGKLQLTVV